MCGCDSAVEWTVQPCEGVWLVLWRAGGGREVVHVRVWMCDLHEAEQSRASEPAPPLSQTCINPHPPPHGSKQHKCHVRVRWRCLRSWFSLVTHSPHRWPRGRDGWSAEGCQGGTLNKNFVCCNAVKETFCYTASQSHTVRGWRTFTISHLNEVDLRVHTCFLQILRLLSIQIPFSSPLIVSTSRVFMPLHAENEI